MTLRILTADEVRRALPMTDAIAAMREAFREISGGTAHVPMRSRMEFSDGQGVALNMPAATPDLLGQKLLTLHSENPGRGLPLIHGVVVMFDTATGQPSGLLEGMTLTAIRTGAASGLATDLLAPEDAHRVAIIGSGVQARTQLEAVCCVRDVRQVSVFSRTPANVEAFIADARHIAGVPQDIVASASVADATRYADIVCTATTATTPVVGIGDIRDRVHINAVGSFKPTMHELGPALVREARKIVDQRDAVLEEAGEIISAIRAGAIDSEDLIEIGEIVAGLESGRRPDDGITVFKSVGLAIQDLHAAGRALARAEAENIGLSLAW